MERFLNLDFFCCNEISEIKYTENDVSQGMNRDSEIPKVVQSLQDQTQTQSLSHKILSENNPNPISNNSMVVNSVQAKGKLIIDQKSPERLQVKDINR